LNEPKIRSISSIPQVTNKKTWKDIAGSLGIGASSSAAYTLRKHYTKHLLPFECKFDRGGIDPQPLINQTETSGKKKGAGKAVPVPSPGSSNSQDSFPGPNNNNTNSSSMDGFNSPSSSSSSYPGPYPGVNAGGVGVGGGPGPGGGEYPPGSTPSPLARQPPSQQQGNTEIRNLLFLAGMGCVCDCE
jgi:AT-rich interactive domain-containing protein 1